TYHGGTYYTPRMHVEVSLHNRTGMRAWLAQLHVSGMEGTEGLQLIAEAAKQVVTRLRGDTLLTPQRERQTPLAPPSEMSGPPGDPVIGELERRIRADPNRLAGATLPDSPQPSA